jgi:aspartyl-tRNA(Asn)/glutamyl-tRNA(Gln) amidotransferase subunit A
MPSHSMFAPKIDDLSNGSLIDEKKWYVADLLNLANFAGTPSITIPVYKNGVKNFGLNINAKQFDDQKLLDIAYTIEELFA